MNLEDLLLEKGLLVVPAEKLACTYCNKLTDKDNFNIVCKSCTCTKDVGNLNNSNTELHKIDFSEELLSFPNLSLDCYVGLLFNDFILDKVEKKPLHEQHCDNWEESGIHYRVIHKDKDSKKIVYLCRCKSTEIGEIALDFSGRRLETDWDYYLPILNGSQIFNLLDTLKEKSEFIIDYSVEKFGSEFTTTLILDSGLIKYSNTVRTLSVLGALCKLAVYKKLRLTNGVEEIILNNFKKEKDLRERKLALLTRR